MSILVADDHNLVRSALCAYLSTHTWGTVASAATLDASLQVITDKHFDILLLDLNMPGVNGCATVRNLATMLQETRIVVWTGDLGSGTAKQCIEAGARGFIPKDMSLNLLLPALNLVNSGEIFLPGKYMFSALNAGTEDQKDPQNVSETELKVLKMIEEGAQNKAIALEIGKSETNVKAMARKIFLKIGAKNRAHAVHISKANGWI